MKYIALFACLFFAAETNGQINPQELPQVCAWETCVPVTKEVGKTVLPLRGIVEFRYWGFKVYVAALYAPANSIDIEENLGKEPIRLELHYYRELSANDFISSAQQVLEKNPEVDLSLFQNETEKINSWYQDVNFGDSYALSYHPDSGLTLSLNNIEKGTIASSSFARAYLSIWLSKNYSLSKSLTERLTKNESR